MNENQMPTHSLHIQPMHPVDIATVVTLEQSCGLSSWGVAGYEQELANPAAVLRVAYLNGQLAGYLAGRVLGDEFELFSLAVQPELRRQGIARRLLEQGLQELRGRGVQRWWLEVRAANSAAQGLYQSYGFTAIGRRRDYYHNPVDDALLMALEGPSAEECSEGA